MRRRRIGCMAFGISWAIIFGVTNFGLALGDTPEGALNPLQVAFWVEVAVFLIGLAIFIRAEMKDADL